MNISISGRHVDVTEGMKATIQEKFGKLDRLYHSIQSIEVILKADDRSNHCEAIIHVRDREPLVVDVARDQFAEAVDVAVEKCEQQLRRLKEKLSDKRRKSSVRAKAKRGESGSDDAGDDE